MRSRFFINCRLIANQIIECGESCLGAIAHRNDNLFVGRRADVTCRKNAGNVCPVISIDIDFVFLIEFDGCFLQPFGCRNLPDLDENSFHVESPFRNSSHVFIDQSGYFLAVSFHFGSQGLRDQSHVFQCEQLVLQNGVGRQCRIANENADMFGNTGQIDGGFDSGVTASDNGNTLVFVKRAVAVRAERYPRPIYCSSPGTSIFLQFAPVARMTVLLLTDAPLASCTSISSPGIRLTAS